MSENRKSRFALFFGNRGLFPSSLMAAAREELPRVLREMGHEVLMMDEKATRFGAVETTREGQIYAEWLRQNRGKFDGVILSLPNFGDETGAVAALEQAGVPIFVQAYPDAPDLMGPATRRDSFCGKISISDVFYQYDVPFTVMKPHTVAPSSPRFTQNIDVFDRVCRVVNGTQGMVVGALGARTTPFKTVRIDEVALQRAGITCETIDMSDVFARTHAVDTASQEFKDRAEQLRAKASWDNVPEKNFQNAAKFWVAVDAIADEYQMDCMGIRCWTELQNQLGISPCAMMGILNEGARPVSCEVDVGNAVMMKMLSLAGDGPVGLLDWNNNYGEEDEKCILFHCGSMPPSMMSGKGCVTDHAIIANVVGEGASYGCNQGRITPGPFTFGSLMTAEGDVRIYLGTGRFTADPLADDFFGCAGVAEIPGLQDVLMHIVRSGHRHHVAVAPGNALAALAEAAIEYLGIEVAIPQEVGD